MSIVIYELIIHETQQEGTSQMARMPMRKFPYYYKSMSSDDEIRRVIQDYVHLLSAIYRRPSKYEIFKIEITPTQAQHFVYDHFFSDNAKPERTTTLVTFSDIIS